jgi:hypothetical protein
MFEAGFAVVGRDPAIESLVDVRFGTGKAGWRTAEETRIAV